MARKAFVPLLLCLGIALASAWLIVAGVHTYCENRAPLTILATLSAFIIAMCFRLLARPQTTRDKWTIGSTILLAAGILFINARVVISYGHLCDALQQNLQQLNQQK